MSYTYEYPHPAVAVDVVALAVDPKTLVTKVLLIRRGNEPWLGKLALPGGFMNIDERSSDAAARELFEETGVLVDADSLHCVGVADGVDRDPRERVVSILFVAVLDQPMLARAGDDAADAAWYDLDQVDFANMAGDHGDILAGIEMEADC